MGVVVLRGGGGVGVWVMGSGGGVVGGVILSTDGGVVWMMGRVGGI